MKDSLSLSISLSCYLSVKLHFSILEEYAATRWNFPFPLYPIEHTDVENVCLFITFNNPSPPPIHTHTPSWGESHQGHQMTWALCAHRITKKKNKPMQVNSTPALNGDSNS